MIIPLAGRLMTCSIGLIFIAAAVMAVKTLLRRHLSLKVQYRLWFPFLSVLAVPFIPVRLYDSASVFSWIHSLKAATGGMIYNKFAAPGNLAGISGEWLKDFSVSVSRQAPLHFYNTAFFIWIAGVIFMTALTVGSCIRINRIKQASLPLQNKKLRMLFDSCKRELGIKQEIPILSTACLKSPVTVGVIRPCIIIPIPIITELDEKELRFILMHELSHYKNKDTFINQLSCMAQILYWFHPVVWFAMKELRRDEESACDGAVLDRLEAKEYLSYGDTVLKFAARLSGISYTPTAGMGGRAKDLKKRILGIRDYRYETRSDKAKGAAALTLITALVFSITPAIASNADSRSSYRLRAQYVEEVDLSSYFQGYEGSFVFYDTHADQFHIYNPKAALKRVSPDSTYKIYSALTALEAGVITPDSTAQRWDGTNQPFEAWNQDHTLSSAMKNSVNWYFNVLDGQSGLEKLQHSLNSIHYGNEDLSGGLSTYWAESTLKISPVEQVELLARLASGNLPFKPENLQAVKESLFLTKSGCVSLYGKTGTGAVNNKDINGWFIGFIQSSQNTYVFAVNLQGDDCANGAAAGEIALDILRDHLYSLRKFC